MTNFDRKTGVAYGYIAARDLDPELVQELMFGSQATDLSYFEAEREARREHRGHYDDFDFYYEAYEPTIEGVYDEVFYQTSWLGGALNFWIFYSPVVTQTANRASPCVPGAGILPSGSGDVTAYDVPAKWLYDYEEQAA